MAQWSHTEGHAVNAQFYDSFSGVLIYQDNQSEQTGFANPDALQWYKVYYRN